MCVEWSSVRATHCYVQKGEIQCTSQFLPLYRALLVLVVLSLGRSYFPKSPRAVCCLLFIC
jgi:hypothetical protein